MVRRLFNNQAGCNAQVEGCGGCNATAEYFEECLALLMPDMETTVRRFEADMELPPPGAGANNETGSNSSCVEGSAILHNTRDRDESIEVRKMSHIST